MTGCLFPVTGQFDIKASLMVVRNKHLFNPLDRPQFFLHTHWICIFQGNPQGGGLPTLLLETFGAAVGDDFTTIDDDNPVAGRLGFTENMG